MSPKTEGAPGKAAKSDTGTKTAEAGADGTGNPPDNQKAPRKVKPDFKLTDVGKAQLTAVDADGKGGQFTAAPNGFDFESYAPLKAADFEDELHFMGHRANVADAKALIHTERANELRTKIAELEKAGTPEQRKKLARRQKLIDQLAQLDSTLAEEGIEVSE